MSDKKLIQLKVNALEQQNRVLADRLAEQSAKIAALEKESKFDKVLTRISIIVGMILGIATVVVAIIAL